MPRETTKRVRLSSKSQGGLRRYVSARDFLAIANSPVLNWENSDDFDRVRGALEYEIDPRGFIEELYVGEVAVIVWELLRLRRLKQMKINGTYWEKLHDLLHEQCVESDESKEDASETTRFDQEQFDRVWELANGWFEDEKVRKKISQELDGYEIDEAQLELSVMDDLSEELEALDRAIAGAEMRRDRALLCVAEYRASLATKIKKSIAAVIDHEAAEVPRLEDKTDEESPD